MKKLLQRTTPLGLLLASCLQFFIAPALAQSTITTFAGGGASSIDGVQATTVHIGSPNSVVSDGAGGFYFSSDTQRVYRVRANGALTVIAGNGEAGFNGDGGPATSAQLNYPGKIAVDGSGNVFIADRYNFRIRKVTPGGVITTVAGIGTSGFSGDGGPATAARLDFPAGVCVDGSGNLFISVSSNRVRKVNAAGIITTVAGNGANGFSGDGGPATSAQLNSPTSIAVDGTGNLFIADDVNNRIRRVTPTGIISTVAGNGTYGFNGDGGLATSASLGTPYGVALDAEGSLLIIDGNNRVRKVTPDGIIRTVAGSGNYGFAGDGDLAISARLSGPHGIGVDGAGNLFIADTGNYRIRKVTPEGIINTVAGVGTFAGDGGPAASASLLFPTSVAIDAAGSVFIADTYNQRIRKVSANGIITTVAGDGTRGSSGNGGPAISAQLNYPAAVAVDSAGNLFIADSCAGPIRKVSPDGIITAFGENDAGGRCDYYYGIYVAPGLAVDAAGNLFVAEPAYHRIRKITPAGAVSTVAGSELQGFSGDGGPATSARLNTPGGVAVDAAGNLFIADSFNYRVRKVTPAGIISTVAGNGIYGFGGDGAPAVSASMRYPVALAVDPAGDLLIVDFYDHRVRMLLPSGNIRTVAGAGLEGFGGDGGPATSALLSYPSGIAIDAAGNILIADSYNSRIRRVESSLVTPGLTSVTLNFGAQGTTVNVTLVGIGFYSPLTVDAGSGVAVSATNVVTDILATATLTIAPNATLGARSLTVTTVLGTSPPVPFTVVPPFPDLLITSAHAGNLAVGSNAIFTVNIVNVGTAVTPSALTITDELPPGLTFVSSAGSGWTCSALGQTVTCVNPGALAAGTSTNLTLTVAVGTGAPSSLTHTPKVTVAGDLIASNNTASDTAAVATLTPTLRFTPDSLAPAQQSAVRLSVPLAFPFDVTGILRMTFSPDAAIPADDPAIQFATGGREVAFTIPANTLDARFGTNAQATLLGFQPGTVAGALSFSGTIQAGTAQSTFSATRNIPKLPPAIQAAHTDTADGFGIVITLVSTLREVNALTLRFDTTAPVRLSCGDVMGCTVSGSTLTFDVRTLFEHWFASEAALGSLSLVRLPLSIQGNVHGTGWITFRNSLGSSQAARFSLP